MRRALTTFLALSTPLAGCQRSAEVTVGDLTLTADPDVATVVHATWTTDADTVGYVRFGTSDAYDMATPAESTAGTEHSATIYGLRPDTDYHFAAAAVVDGEDAVGADATWTTGALPSDMPEVTEDTAWSNPEAGPYLLTSFVAPDVSYSYAAVLDTSGAVVWYHRVDTEVACVRPLLDGSGVYYVRFELQDADASTLEQVRWDGTSTVLAVPQIHHDAQAMADGTFAATRTTYQDVDGVTIGGDQIIRVQPDGTTSVVWDAFDNLPITENDGWDYIHSAGFADWTHVNGLVYDAASDLFVISLWNAYEIVAVDATTGAQRWVFGGVDGQFPLPEADTFGPQHAPEVFDGGIRLFDNNTVAGGSRLVEYALDTTAMTAELTWSHTPAANQFTPVLGDVHRFDDGRTLSSWGYTGRIQSIDAAGQVDGQISAPYGTTVGQVTVLPGFYGE